jgi:hypothetical protein
MFAQCEHCTTTDQSPRRQGNCKAQAGNTPRSCFCRPATSLVGLASPLGCLPARLRFGAAPGNSQTASGFAEACLCKASHSPSSSEELLNSSPALITLLHLSHYCSFTVHGQERFTAKIEGIWQGALLLASVVRQGVCYCSARKMHDPQENVLVPFMGSIFLCVLCIDVDMDSVSKHKL